jgi:signal transduction histidine kinase
MMNENTCEEIRNLYLEESPSDWILSVEESGDIKGMIQGSGGRDREFAIHINHEVRTSMTAIMGFSQLLRQDSLTCEDRLAYAEYICQETERLLGTFNQLLELL